MEIEERIKTLADAINKQVVRLANARYKENTNVWVFSDGSYAPMVNAGYLRNTVDDEKNKLDDMLRQLDRLVEERDGT